MSAVLTHLWSSTFVLAVALLAARFLPLTARTRHAVVFCGLLKFLVPAAAIATPLAAIGLDLERLGRNATGSIVIEWLGNPASLRALQPRPASPWPDALALAWLVTAAAVAGAWAIARVRIVSSALDSASAASPRERAALSAARHALGLRASVDLRRSSICEAPAVLRIIRPVVVLPDGGCDALDDAELESLLRHECAHVARRDNLLGLIESAIVAVFWFHPLVWVAQRAAATAREEACDETAATSADSVDTYVSALSKICRMILAPQLPGVSCMANAHLKERLHYLMSYETLRTRALSHRVVVALAAVVVVTVAACSTTPATTSEPMHSSTPAATSHFSGEPITITLEKAELKNVLDTFAKLTGTKIRYSPSLQGSVTLDARNMPWDEALEVVLRQNNLTYELDGKTIVVKER